MVTLDRLVNVLGSYGVRLSLCPIPRSTELRSVVMHEVTNDRTVVGDVLLGIGARSVEEAVRWATSAHAVVVLIRGGDGDAAIDREYEGVAVMVVEPAVSWSELAAIIYGLVLEGRETESGRGPTDLFALADSLAEAAGGAVTIEDKLSRLLAYSKLQQHADPARVETIVGRQAPKDLRALFDARGVFAHLAASDDPLFVTRDTSLGLTGRMVVAVRSGRELMGSVWVACSAPLRGPARTALADGGRTVALHLLRSRASADLERQVESELVIRLLEGAADAATAASRLGLPHSPLRVIAVQAFIEDERDAALLLAFERATTGFGWSRPGRSALAGNTVYTLLPGEQAEPARRWVSGLRAALPDGVNVIAGISGAGLVADLPTARDEADESLALHEGSPPGAGPVAYDESWDHILLQRLRTAARSGRSPDRGPVAELRRHDRANATEYVATLQAWLEAQGDPVEAGERLGVHENTVRYRLRIRTSEVRRVSNSGNGVEVELGNDAPLTADVAVISTGAWFSRLADDRVRVPVRAGRGYSFTVPVDRPIPGPIYLPDVRVACTPYQGGLRVSGTMEFRDPEEPIVPARVGAIVASASPLLDGVRWAERSDIWVGARPVTPDGRALIGEMSRGVYVAGGHGMWGLAHGPVTGRLLAEQITTGKQPEALREFDPLRRTGR